MQKPPVWVRADVVLALHRRQISEHGGHDGIRDNGLFESALSRPQNLFNYSDPKPTMAQLAAAYTYGLVKNHPFADGNKRTAFTVFRLFLQLNGRDLKASKEEKYQVIMRLASGELSEESFANWLSNRITTLKKR